MKNSSHFCPVPASIRFEGSRPWCGPVLIAGILLALPLTFSSAHAAPLGSMQLPPMPIPAKAKAPIFIAPDIAQKSQTMTLDVGKSIALPVAPGAKFRVEAGAPNAICEISQGTLNVRALSAGIVMLRVEAPNQALQRYILTLSDARALPNSDKSFTNAQKPAANSQIGFGTPLLQGDSSATRRLVKRQVSSQIVATPGAPGVSSSDPLDLIPSIPAPGALGTTQPPTLFPPAEIRPNTPAPALPPLPAFNPNPAPPAGTTPAVNLNPTMPAGAQTPIANLNPAPVRTPAPLQVLPVQAAPDRKAPTVTRISPVLPQPAKSAHAKVSYTTTPRLPKNVNPKGAKSAIPVAQGLARLLSFPANILSVFFSDPAVMDARAINARTIAVTGMGAGNSTLAVFTARYPGDAVGQANIYRIQTSAKAPVQMPSNQDPRTVTLAVTEALGDPRIRASVFKLPDGALATRLTGTVRNPAEVEGAVTTAAFFAPRVLSSLYADPTAPSIDAVLNGTAIAPSEPTLQDNLRRLTGNNSIELIPLPTGMGLKAEVNSTAEAEQLLRYLPSLNQQILPFIVVHGAANGAPQLYDSQVPFLQGEDRQLTDKLQSVTGIRTVYAVRASANSVALYGTVKNRAEFATVRRYGLIVAQTSIPVATAGSTQGGGILRPLGYEQPTLPAYDPTSGYMRQLGVQMFVRISDPRESTIRNVNVETSVVEISRTALKNLGLEYGSVNVTGESIQLGNPGVTTVVPGTNGGNPTATVTPGTRDVITRTIDPTVQNGALTFSNGFAGGAGLGLLSPIRARLNALAQSGDARILSRPTVRAVEGMSAQITIGGERPVPSGAITNGAATNSVEFRRYGVIISMRPTVTDDNTILLQIRADVTQPDRTFEINLNGSLIPGEVVRSIDTTLTVRPGDTVIMGGLMTNEKRQQTTKVPILGDLPIIGSLFRSKRFENNETELAIFMTPRIEAIPATPESLETLWRAPSFPALPSRSESNSILFQDTTRQAQ